jgi:hypothetical protein
MNTVIKALSVSVLGMAIASCCATPKTTSDTATTSTTARAAASTDLIDKAHGNGKANGRIWVVTSIVNTPHLELGDAFRIELARDQVKLVPLHLLQQHWAKDATFALPLLKTTGAEKKLCGLVDIDTSTYPHPPDKPDLDDPPHIIMIEQVGDDEIVVSFYAGSDDPSMPVVAQCQNLDVHGGTAHAKN